MSGPKVDVAEIRNQEMQRLAQARENRRELADKLNAFLKELKKNTEDSDLKKETEKSLKKLLRTVKLGNEMLEIDVITRQANELMKAYQEGMGERLRTQAAGAQRKLEEKAANEFHNRVRQIQRKNVVIQEADEDEVKVSAAEVKQLEELFSAEMQRVMQAEETTRKGKTTLLVLHQDLQKLMDSELPLERKYKRMNRMLEEFEKTVKLIEKDYDGMRQVYEEYCREAFDLETEEIKKIGDFGSVEEIREAIEEAKDKAMGNMSKEYIKRQIDEVMQKHGYNVVRSDMLVQANDSGQILYGVDEETAINVFVSEESQVTMRVVGIGFDDKISGEEDEKLFQQQCAFCSLHPQITKELEMRGVILHTRKHMAPDKKFNKKIQIKEKSGTQNMSKAKKELKRNESKVMYRE